MKHLTYMMVIAFVLSLTVYSCAKKDDSASSNFNQHNFQHLLSKAACKCSMNLPRLKIRRIEFFVSVQF